MSYSVARNTSVFTVASILQKAISFVYFIVIARTIGVENTGVYFFAIAFTTIFTVLADFGLNPILTREAARHPENSAIYLSTVFWMKLIFGFIAYGLVILTVNGLNYPILTRHLVYLAGVTMLFDNLHSGFYSLLRARKNLLFEAIGVVGSQFVTMVVGSLALLLHWPLYWLILAYTIPSMLNVLYSSSVARYYLKAYPRFIWDKGVMKLFLRLAIPFALAGFITRLYAYSDSLLMSKLLTPRELGWWSVPYKITFAFQFIPVALTASIYPAMSSLFLVDKAKVGELFVKAWRYLLIIVLPLVAGIIAIAEPVIVKIYHPDYLPSVPVLQILLLSLVFVFLCFVNGATLNAIDKQKVQTSLLFMALTVNLFFNIWFIPRWGIIGAAWSSLIGNVALYVVGFLFVRKNIPIDNKENGKHISMITLSAAAMGVAVYFIAQKINFILAIPIGVMIYVALLFFTRELTVQLLRDLWRKNI